MHLTKKREKVNIYELTDITYVIKTPLFQIVWLVWCWASPRSVAQHHKCVSHFSWFQILTQTADQPHFAKPVNTVSHGIRSRPNLGQKQAGYWQRKGLILATFRFLNKERYQDSHEKEMCWFLDRVSASWDRSTGALWSLLVNKHSLRLLFSPKCIVRIYFLYRGHRFRLNLNGNKNNLIMNFSTFKMLWDWNDPILIVKQVISRRPWGVIYCSTATTLTVSWLLWHGLAPKPNQHSLPGNVCPCVYITPKKKIEKLKNFNFKYSH